MRRATGDGERRIERERQRGIDTEAERGTKGTRRINKRGREILEREREKDK